MFPIKYIDNNLVWNKDNEVFAYYELIPYNYSFLSAEQKFIVHDSFRQLIAQSREGKIHALQIATESSIRSMQEQSKKLVTGKLKEVACQKIDEQTEALVSMIGDNQVDYRFFLGFKLMVTEEQLNLKNIKKSAWLTFKEFLHEVNHTLMNDFVSMPNDEINRYMKMEKLLENKISRRFKVRRLEINDFGYLMEHLYGRDGIAYEDYEYQIPKKNYKKETLIKYYDLIRPTRCVIEESQRYLRLEHEDKESYGNMFYVELVNQYLTVPQISGELAQKVMNEALKYQGWKYVYGGSNPNTSFDCSGLTQWCFGKAGISLPRTAQMQYDATQHIPLSQAKAGDLVFFHSTYDAGSYVTHVGIVISPTQMYHAGDPIGYADLTNSYWQQHLIGAGRVKQ